MSIKLKIDPKISPEEADKATKPVPDAVISLEVRKTIDGKIMILDHMHLDIILDTVRLVCARRSPYLKVPLKKSVPKKAPYLKDNT